MLVADVRESNLGYGQGRPAQLLRGRLRHAEQNRAPGRQDDER
jgi:hypothetical protein